MRVAPSETPPPTTAPVTTIAAAFATSPPTPIPTPPEPEAPRSTPKRAQRRRKARTAAGRIASEHRPLSAAAACQPWAHSGHLRRCARRASRSLGGEPTLNLLRDRHDGVTAELAAPRAARGALSAPGRATSRPPRWRCQAPPAISAYGRPSSSRITSAVALARGKLQQRALQLVRRRPVVVVDRCGAHLLDEDRPLAAVAGRAGTARGRRCGRSRSASAPAPAGRSPRCRAR